MKPQNLGLRVAGSLFGLMAMVQLLRLLLRLDVLVAGYVLPLWVSAVAVVVLGGMSVWLWKLALVE